MEYYLTKIIFYKFLHHSFIQNSHKNALHSITDFLYFFTPAYPPDSFILLVCSSLWSICEYITFDDPYCLVTTTIDKKYTTTRLDHNIPIERMKRYILI